MIVFVRCLCSVVFVHLIWGINGSLGLKNGGKRPRCVTLGCFHTQKPVVSVKHVSFHYQAVNRQKDYLAAFYLFLFFLFWEQLKRSVNFGCPLLQDYSLLNLLAAFSIILSYVSLPSCSLTSTLGDRLREMEIDRQRERERDREQTGQ